MVLFCISIRSFIVPEHKSDQLYPIGTVSEMTGVNSITLRAWERRYGLIQPQRTPKGHRLYSQYDIELIETILQNLNQGLSISKVSDRLKHALDPITKEPVSDVWINYRERMINAIALFDESVLDAVYNEAMALYPVDVVTRKMIEPLLEDLGERWQKAVNAPDQIPIAEEHFFSVFIRNKLGARFHHRNIQNHGPRLVLACMPGEFHEFGLLLFALAAHARGFRIILLGADMPLHELPIVVHKTGCDGIVLAGSERLSCEALYCDLAELARQMNEPVFIGGQLSINCHQTLSKLKISLIGTDLSDALKIIGQSFALKNL
jgi:DNA-binding transcriptional MerR regulator